MNNGRWHAQPLIEQGARVIGVPLLAVITEVIAERLLAPRALRRRDDRREGRHRTKTVLTPQPDGQRAMPAHRMTRDRLPRQVGAREIDRKSTRLNSSH